MQRTDADEVLDHLHEVLDERFEAGPAPYVIDTMTAESQGRDDWAVEVVYQPAVGAQPHGLRLRGLDGRAPLEAAWTIYRRLESAEVPDAEADHRGVCWSTL